MEGFEYILNPIPTPKVAFGSGIPRECLPTSGPALSPFMRSIQGEILEYPGPFEYFQTKYVGFPYPSKLGFSAFANKLPRLIATKVLDTPPLGSYDVEKPREFQQSIKPFGISSDRPSLGVMRSPGPAAYFIPSRWLYENINSAFGTCRKIPAAVMVECTPHNLAKCYICGRTPIGDYVRNYNTKQDMCRKCLDKELKILKACDYDLFLRIKRYREIYKFVPTRYCGFYHNHNGTTAAIPIISRKELRKKLLVENYLYKYTNASREITFK